MHTPSTRILSALAYDRQRAQIGSPAGGGQAMTLGAVRTGTSCSPTGRAGASTRS